MSKIFICILLVIPPLTVYSQTNFWTQTNGLFSGTVYDYSSVQENVVYAGSDNGVYKSIDNGVTWIEIGFQGIVIPAICKVPSSTTLFAGLPNGNVNVSTNEGLSWTPCLYTYGVRDIKVLQGNIFVTTFRGVYKSTNFGNNWSHFLPETECFSLDISPNNYMYVAAYEGLFRSTDSGNEWIKLNGFKGNNVRTVGVLENNFIFAATWNGTIYKSTNDGVNFVDLGAINLIYKTSCLLTSKDGYIYCGTFYQGIWKSSDYGFTWLKQYPGERNNYFVFNLSEGFNGNAFASVNHNSVVRTTDHGDHWNNFRFRNSYRYTNILVSSEERVFANDGYISEDNGFNWVYPDYEFQPSNYSRNILTNTIFATEVSTKAVGGIYRSVNNGNDWDFINMTDLGVQFYNLYVSKIGHVYVSGGGNMNFGHLNKSTDDGLNWSQVSDYGFFALASNSFDVLFGKRSGQHLGVYRSTNHGQNWDHVLDLTDNNGQMYVTNSGDVYAGGNNTLHKSTDNGNNWTQENITGLVTSILENQNGRLFISTYDSGRVYKTDGDSLVDLTYNLSGQKIHTMCFNTSGQLLVGTDQGVYVSNQTLIGINGATENIPKGFILHQNYPNPFNPSTVIRYQLSENSFVTLKVYDVSGRVVSVLIDENKTVGIHDIVFERIGLASGIYYYKLTAGNFSETKKMVLLK